MSEVEQAGGERAVVGTGAVVEGGEGVVGGSVVGEASALEELRKQVQSVRVMAAEARELAASAGARAGGAGRGGVRTPAGAQGPRLEEDSRARLAEAARAAARSGDRRSLMDYLELKRASA